MLKPASIIIAPVICITLFFACKKPNNNNNNNNNSSAFVDSLKRTCTTPFVGAGDSSSVWLATAFTPNGDGIDDLYRAFGKYFTCSAFTMNIYDTTGKLVFHSSSASYPWDGVDTSTGKQATQYKFFVEVSYTTTGNKSAAAGTYVYLLSNSTTGCVNRVAADTSKYEFEDQFDFSAGYNASWSSNETFCN